MSRGNNWHKVVWLQCCATNCDGNRDGDYFCLRRERLKFLKPVLEYIFNSTGVICSVENMVLSSWCARFLKRKMSGSSRRGWESETVKKRLKRALIYIHLYIYTVPIYIHLFSFARAYTPTHIRNKIYDYTWYMHVKIRMCTDRRNGSYECVVYDKHQGAGKKRGEDNECFSRHLWTRLVADCCKGGPSTLPPVSGN